MMTIYEKIKSDQLAARKAKESVKINLLTTILGELMQNRIEDDQRVISLLKKYKDTLESVKVLHEGALMQTGSIEAELNIVESYMPSTLDNDKLAELVANYKSANPDHKIGQFMGYVGKWVVDNNMLIDRKEASKLWSSLT